MDVPNLRTMGENLPSSKNGLKPVTPGAKDSLSGDNKITEYRTKGAGFTKPMSAGQNTNT